MPSSYSSRIPAILADAAKKIDAANRRTAERVEQEAKARLQGDQRLRDTIRTERTTDGYEVLVGEQQGRAHYPHVREFGGAGQAARPFLVPAAEDAATEHVNAIRRAFEQ